MKKVLLSFLFLVAALFVAPSFAFAGSEHNLSGFAWSSNIGWISFNSINDHDSGTAGIQSSSINYGVNLDLGTGDLTGYAWSSNIGWIQFGGLSGFPTGAGTQAVNAKLSGSSMVGWARALSANDSGWDGWISLGGTGYGVTQSGTALIGYAWGSSVVGWTDFAATGMPGCSSDCGVIVGGDLPSVSLDVLVGSASIDGRSDVENSSVGTLSWSLANLPSGTTCAVSKTSSGGTSFTTLTGITASSTASTGTLSQASYTYQILCQDSGGYSNTQSVSFTVLAQEPGFSLGGNETIDIQFINNNSADSEQKTIYIGALGGFTDDVTLSVGGISPGLSASTTILYSLDGGSFVASPTPVDVAYNGAVPFKIRLSSPIPNACSSTNVPVGCQWYDVTINGTASGVPSQAKIFRIRQTPFSPRFEEI